MSRIYPPSIEIHKDTGGTAVLDGDLGDAVLSTLRLPSLSHPTQSGEADPDTPASPTARENPSTAEIQVLPPQSLKSSSKWMVDLQWFDFDEARKAIAEIKKEAERETAKAYFDLATLFHEQLGEAERTGAFEAVDAWVAELSVSAKYHPTFMRAFTEELRVRASAFEDVELTCVSAFMKTNAASPPSHPEIDETFAEESFPEELREAIEEALLSQPESGDLALVEEENQDDEHPDASVTIDGTDDRLDARLPTGDALAPEHCNSDPRPTLAPSAKSVAEYLAARPDTIISAHELYEKTFGRTIGSATPKPLERALREARACGHAIVTVDGPGYIYVKDDRLPFQLVNVLSYDELVVLRVLIPKVGVQVPRELIIAGLQQASAPLRNNPKRLPKVLSSLDAKLGDHGIVKIVFGKSGVVAATLETWAFKPDEFDKLNAALRRKAIPSEKQRGFREARSIGKLECALKDAPDTPLSLTKLVEAVWGEGDLAQKTKQIQHLISDLRKRDEPIVAIPGYGYVYVTTKMIPPPIFKEIGYYDYVVLSALLGAPGHILTRQALCETFNAKTQFMRDDGASPTGSRAVLSAIYALHDRLSKYGAIRLDTSDAYPFDWKRVALELWDPKGTENVAERIARRDEIDRATRTRAALRGSAGRKRVLGLTEGSQTDESVDTTRIRLFAKDHLRQVLTETQFVAAFGEKWGVGRTVGEVLKKSIRSLRNSGASIVTVMQVGYLFEDPAVIPATVAKQLTFDQYILLSALLGHPDHKLSFSDAVAALKSGRTLLPDKRKIRGNLLQLTLRHAAMGLHEALGNHGAVSIDEQSPRARVIHGVSLEQYAVAPTGLRTEPASRRAELDKWFAARRLKNS